MLWVEIVLIRRKELIIDEVLVKLPAPSSSSSSPSSSMASCLYLSVDGNFGVR